MAFLSRNLPLMTVITVIIAIWYAAVIWMNSPFQIDRYEKAGTEWNYSKLVKDTMSQKRPVLPAAHQVATEIWKTTVMKKITSKRSLIFHTWVTFSATMLGFIFGTILGIVLAVLIVHNRAVDPSTKSPR